VIPNSVTIIGNGAFNGCVNLTSIKIPSSVTSIGNFAFRNCKNLKSIEIPNSVIEIEMSAFEGCRSLVSINISNNVTSIDFATFYGCNGLTNIDIPNSVYRIGYAAFFGCTSLTSIKMPNSVNIIDEGAFEGIKKVKPQYKENGALRAFKGFLSDWTCRDFQYEVGKSFHQEGEIKCCENGFHACTNPLDVFNYYNGHLDELRFAEVELSGEMHKNFDKVAASDIKIVRELTVQELFEIYNNMEKV
jgi:hypothetical protein